jgi:hypothetical protein
MFFNALFVRGAGVSAAFMPISARSVPLMAAIAIGYALTAAGYLVLSRSAIRPTVSG